MPYRFALRKPPLDLVGDHPGLVMLAIARAVDKGDWATARFGRERVEGLCLLGIARAPSWYRA